MTDEPEEVKIPFALMGYLTLHGGRLELASLEDGRWAAQLDITIKTPQGEERPVRKIGYSQESLQWVITFLMEQEGLIEPGVEYASMPLPDSLVKHMRQQGGALVLFYNKGDNDWTIGYLFGREEPDNPDNDMAGGAAYGVGATLKASLDMVLHDVGLT